MQRIIHNYVRNTVFTIPLSITLSSSNINPFPIRHRAHQAMNKNNATDKLPDHHHRPTRHALTNAYAIILHLHF